MKYVFSAILSESMLLGQKVVIRTKNNKYLAQIKGNKSDIESGHEWGNESDNDYSLKWQNPCSLKAANPGPMIQKDVLGCGGRVEMKCTGGCLRILKVLYSCSERNETILEQLRKVQDRCENKESCTVSASRGMFGNTECPDLPDGKMKMWIVFRCDGGEGTARITGARRCKTTITGELYEQIWTNWIKYKTKLTWFHNWQFFGNPWKKEQHPKKNSHFCCRDWNNCISGTRRYMSFATWRHG